MPNNDTEARAKEFLRAEYDPLPSGWTEDTLNWLNTERMVAFARAETARLTEQLAKAEAVISHYARAKESDLQGVMYLRTERTKALSYLKGLEKK